ncbi:MAG: murein L,D-transpeptidase catalytic domain family protein, partial [Flavipsychrobacter sp.]
ANTVDQFIANTYRQIDFSGADTLSYDVFAKAYHGYINLYNEGKLNPERQLLTICDMTESSTRNRMWVIDLASKKVLFNTYVAHGQGSGEEFATSFSNEMNSHKSSLGFYVTGETYDGEHGTSLRLYGMDKGFNNSAYDRSVVVHGADYVCGKFIENNQKLGRSWGCPAVSSKLSGAIINTIKDGSCLFIYYPEKKFLASSYWMNKKVTVLPGSKNALMFQNTAFVPNGDTVIQYVSSAGNIDSVRHINHSF